MVILQDSCKTDGYLARFLQDGWLSCKILQDFGRKSCKTMYRLARFCKHLARSCKITIWIRLGKCTPKARKDLQLDVPSSDIGLLLVPGTLTFGNLLNPAEIMN